jgi:hypothetical protein
MSNNLGKVRMIEQKKCEYFYQSKQEKNLNEAKVWKGRTDLD